MATRLLFDLIGEVNDRGFCAVAGGAGQWQPAVTVEQGVIYAALSEGRGHWLIEVVRAEGGHGPLLASRDGDCISCSFILNPGELVQATVIGAPPRSRVRGSVNGTQAWNPDELPPLYGASACGEGFELPHDINLNLRGLELPHDINLNLRGLELPHDINLNLREPIRVIMEGTDMPCPRCGQEPCCCPGFPITSPTPPSNPNFGQVWLDNSSLPPMAKVWDGRQWTLIRANATLLQEFRSGGSYSYVLPANAIQIHVLLLAGGGGGQAGARVASGTASQGGTGGNGGASEQHWISAAQILSLYPNGTVPVAVGAGGAGGIASGTDNTAIGALGAQGGSSQFGSGAGLAFGLVSGGLGGGQTTTNPLSSSIGLGATQPASGTAPGSATPLTTQSAQGTSGNGGGGGGSITTAPALIVPQNGAVRQGVGIGTQTYILQSGATNVAIPGGSLSVSPNYAGSSGSGGAASLTAAATAGNPGIVGSGGGGGGASLNGFASGPGGKGGDGYIVIETYF